MPPIILSPELKTEKRDDCLTKSVFSALSLKPEDAGRVFIFFFSHTEPKEADNCLPSNEVTPSALLPYRNLKKQTSSFLQEYIYIYWGSVLCKVL